LHASEPLCGYLIRYQRHVEREAPAAQFAAYVGKDVRQLGGGEPDNAVQPDRGCIFDRPKDMHVRLPKQPVVFREIRAGMGSKLHGALFRAPIQPSRCLARGQVGEKQRRTREFVTA